MARAMPPDLNNACRWLLLTLLTYSDDDGGGIYAATETLIADTGMSSGNFFKHLRLLTLRGYVVNEGKKRVGRNMHTVLRRIDFQALQRDRNEAAREAVTQPRWSQVAAPEWSESKKEYPTLFPEERVPALAHARAEPKARRPQPQPGPAIRKIASGRKRVW